MASQAGYGENRLDDEAPRHEGRRQRADITDDRQQGVAQGMVADEGPRADAPRPDRADIVLPQGIEQARPGQAHDEGRRLGRQGQGRQDNVSRPLPQGRRQDGPGKGEELDEDRCQDETGHGDAQGGADHHGVVDPGILIPGRGHAGQDAGTDGQKEADEPQLGRYGKGFGNDIVDPVKVTRSALQNATSVASTLLTTESAVANIKEDTPAMPAGGAPGMGGMM